jgi:RimJ/RimL family protein N-acetyltransferase
MLICPYGLTRSCQAGKHADALVKATLPAPQLYAHMPSGPYTSADHFTSEFLDGRSHPDPGFATLAVIDKTKPPSPEDPEGQLAGTMSYMRSSADTGCTEIGWVLILPEYQRTHVATNAVGLMMQYALDAPEEGGLGLKRVQWRAHAANAGSIKVAERMGFKLEGITRWDVFLPKGRLHGKVGNGKPLPPGSHPDDLWRDSVTLSHCWDDWRDGGREKVGAAMSRTN